MNIFYNKKGIGDTILLSITDVDFTHRAFERKGDIVKIYHQETGELAGYNVFQASTYGTIEGNGQLDWSDEMIELLQSAFAKNGVEWTLTIDRSPKFVVGEVKTKEPHPNADKLSICRVNVGSEELQIVCGAPNVDAGQKVVVALEGAVMPSGLVIKKTSLRGVDSTGMICSAKELNLPNAPEEKGILVLEENRQVGVSFF